MLSVQCLECCWWRGTSVAHVYFSQRCVGLCHFLGTRLGVCCQRDHAAPRVCNEKWAEHWQFVQSCFSALHVPFFYFLKKEERTNWGGMWCSILSRALCSFFFLCSGLRSRSAEEWLWRNFLLCSCSTSRGSSLRRPVAVRNWSRTLITLWTWR